VKERGRDDGLESRRARLGFLHGGRDGRMEHRIQERGEGRKGDGGRKIEEITQ